MRKYINNLNILRNYMIVYDSLFQYILRYIKEEISMEELVKIIPSTSWNDMVHIINKIINYKSEHVAYYIEVPRDINFNTISKKAIIKARLDSPSLYYNLLEVLGPRGFLNSSKNFVDSRYLMITGDFGLNFDGTILSFKDYVRIFANSDFIYKLMYDLMNDSVLYFTKGIEKVDMETVREKTDETISKALKGEINNQRDWYLKEMAKDMDTDLINSIRFVFPKEYITLSDIYEGNFKTFRELIKEDEPKLKLL